MTDYSERPLNKYRLQAIHKFAMQGSMLDVGCGNGAYVHYIDAAFNRKVHGVDYKKFSSWNKNKSLFTVGNIQQLKFKDDSFDTILCFEVLEHIENFHKAIEEIYRVTNKRAIFTVPNCQISDAMKKSNLIYGHHSDKTHVNFWDMSSFCDLLKKHKFKIIFKEHINFINYGYLIAESLYLPNFIGNFFAKLIKLLIIRNRYPMSLLVVVDK